eukprot:scaffold1705_cov304-Prasinococcus_capsulatus_cf.AAC.2
MTRWSCRSSSSSLTPSIASLMAPAPSEPPSTPSTCPRRALAHALRPQQQEADACWHARPSLRAPGCGCPPA